MGPRPLRQRYDHDHHYDISIDIDGLVASWSAHRERFVAGLQGLTDDEWTGTTRCEDWTAQQVIQHLHSADGFFNATLTAARIGSPTVFLHDFDPTTSPGTFVDALADWTPDQTLAAFEQGTNAFLDTVADYSDADWQATVESPFGHVPAFLSLAHSAWDSWLHERDILVPLGRAPETSADDRWVPTWYSLFASGLQGGLLADDSPVGPGPEAPIEARLVFDDLDDTAVELQIDETVHLSMGAASGEESRVTSAVAVVEGFTGRSPTDDLGLPDALLAQIERARQVL